MSTYPARSILLVKKKTVTRLTGFVWQPGAKRMTAWRNSIARKPSSNEEKKKKTREKNVHGRRKDKGVIPRRREKKSRMKRYDAKLSESITHLTISDVILLLLDVKRLTRGLVFISA